LGGDDDDGDDGGMRRREMIGVMEEGMGLGVGEVEEKGRDVGNGKGGGSIVHYKRFGK